MSDSDNSHHDNDGHLHVDPDLVDGDHHCPHNENLIFAKIIYGLYLISFLVGGTSSIIGVIIAYIHDKSGPDWLDSHYRFQIRTFWIGLCYSLVSLILTPILIGIFGFIFTAIWLIIRCIKGFKLLIREQEHPNVMTWWV